MDGPETPELYPLWRREELARKYAPPDAYDPDEPDFEEPYEQEEDDGNI